MRRQRQPERPSGEDNLCRRDRNLPTESESSNSISDIMITSVILRSLLSFQDS